MAALPTGSPCYSEEADDFLSTDFRSNGMFALRITYKTVEQAVRRSVESSVMLSRSRLSTTAQNLRALRTMEPDWDSYGAEPPSEEAVQRAGSFLANGHNLPCQPSAVTASAEGGVALMFTGAGGQRVLVEFLNSGEDYGLFYDLSGNGETVMLTPGRESARSFGLRIEHHLRG